MSRGFTSVFADDLDEYLDFRETVGFVNSPPHVWYLRRFDTYCVRHHATLFDQTTVEGWVREELDHAGVWRSFLSFIRQFGRWMAARDPQAYVLSPAWKIPKILPNPYLLTNEQIDRFFDAAARLQAHSPWRWQAAGFFTLMHSCGLRTGETRALRCSDVDLDGAEILIIGTKTRRDRRLPLTPDVVAVLRRCDTQSRAQFPNRSMFFVSAAGNQVAAVSPAAVFRQIWDLAGLPRPTGGKQPTPYAFRHHFAYANLERWMADGTDATTMLPYLSVYMGHGDVESTYYYIHTSPDFMNAYQDTATQVSTMVLPEPGFE